MASQLSVGEEAFESEGSISDRPMSNLEKVHFIVSCAILKPGLRSVPPRLTPFGRAGSRCVSTGSHSPLCVPSWDHRPALSTGVTVVQGS